MEEEKLTLINSEERLIVSDDGSTDASIDLLLTNICDAILRNSKNSNNHSVFQELASFSKVAFALAVGGANAILFYRVSNDLAKDYFGMNEGGQKLVSLSDCYANFFLSVYTSRVLIEFISSNYFIKKMLQSDYKIPYTQKYTQQALAIFITAAVFLFRTELINVNRE